MKKNILQILGLVLLMLVLAYAFVPQVLSGKVLNQSDISGWRGMAQETIVWNNAHPDDHTAWSESMFGGMPNVTIITPTKGDWTLKIYDILLSGKRPATYFFISLLGAFFLMLALGMNVWVAFAGAIAVTFCSYNVQIIQVGHNTKMQAIAFFPWVLAALVFTYRSAVGKREAPLSSCLPGVFGGAALFGLAMSFQIKANHPQISYYLALVILLYVIVLICFLVFKPENRVLLGRFFIASGLLLVLGLAGIGTNATKLLPTLEYTPYSMRGGSTAAKDGTKASKGLDIDYATAWSYGWEELPNMLVPNFNGGSSSGAVNPAKSETYKLLKRAGQSNLKEVCNNLPLYWGPQPFTAGPMYMGAITVFLFILGLLYYKGRDKWWLLAATLLAVLLGLGNHFLAFTRFFFDHIPLYNKFRTVSMSLTVLQVTLPVLGFLMLDSMVKSGEKVAVLRRKVALAAGVTAGLCLVLCLIQSLTGSFVSSSDAGQQDILTDALVADRRQIMWADCWRSVCLVAGACLILLWGVGTKDGKGLSGREVAVLLIAALTLVDLFGAGKRYLKAEDFITPRNMQKQFDKRPVDQMILQDTDPSYRVLDLTVNVFNDSHPSYWHKNIGGYSPAKLQIYQEYIDSHLMGEIGQLSKAIGGANTIGEAQDALPYLEGLSKLNCRYIIIGGDNPPLVYPYARGEAWFNGEGSIEMTSYAPNELHYACDSPVEQKAVFSEVYYPVGWKASLEDGTELEISLSDEVLRSVVVPAGKHEIVMRFDPPAYRTGEVVSRACSILLILLVLGAAAVPCIGKCRCKNDNGK